MDFSVSLPEINVRPACILTIVTDLQFKHPMTKFHKSLRAEHINRDGKLKGFIEFHGGC